MLRWLKIDKQIIHKPDTEGEASWWAMPGWDRTRKSCLYVEEELLAVTWKQTEKKEMKGSRENCGLGSHSASAFIYSWCPYLFLPLDYEVCYGLDIHCVSQWFIHWNFILLWGFKRRNLNVSKVSAMGLVKLDKDIRVETLNWITSCFVWNGREQMIHTRIFSPK